MQLLLPKPAGGDKLKRTKIRFFRIYRRPISPDFHAGEILAGLNKCIFESGHAIAIRHQLVRFQ